MLELELYGSFHNEILNGSPGTGRQAPKGGEEIAVQRPVSVTSHPPAIAARMLAYLETSLSSDCRENHRRIDEASRLGQQQSDNVALKGGETCCPSVDEALPVGAL